MNSASGPAHLIVLDLGNASGRAYLGALEDERLRTEEIYRFGNGPTVLGDRWYWDVLRLFAEVMECRRGRFWRGCHDQRLDGKFQRCDRLLLTSSRR